MLHTATSEGKQVTGALSTPRTKPKNRLLPNVVVGKGPAISQLCTGVVEVLLIRRSSLLVLNLCLETVDSIGGLHLEGDGLAGTGLHKDLHD